MVKLFNLESCPPNEPLLPALALYLVTLLIDLEPVTGIAFNSLLENCWEAPVRPFEKVPFDLVTLTTTSCNAFASSSTTTLTTTLLPNGALIQLFQPF